MNGPRSRFQDFTYDEEETLGPENPLSKYFCVSQRCILFVLCFVAMSISYTTRRTYLEAILWNETASESNSTPCPLDDEESLGPINHIPDRFFLTWPRPNQDIVRSSFYWTYMWVQIPAGYIADRFGAKRILTGAMFGASICSLLEPFLIQSSGSSFTGLMCLRIVEGFFHGAFVPAINSLLAQWAPMRDRALIVSFIFAPLGQVLSTYVGAPLINLTQHWSVTFYLFGSLGVVWCMFFAIFGYSKPAANPFISMKEKDLILDDREGHISDTWRGVPWKAMFKSRAVWALIVAAFCNDWAWFTLVTRLPDYLDEVLNLNVHLNDYWSTVPFIFMWIFAIIFGCLSDWLICEKHVDATIVRKFCALTASIGPAIFLIFGSFAKCGRMTAMACFSIALSLLGVYGAGPVTAILDLAPNYAGILRGIANGAGNIIGGFSPFVVGHLTRNNTFEQWNIIFWLTFAVLIFSGLFFLINGSARERAWNIHQ